MADKTDKLFEVQLTIAMNRSFYSFAVFISALYAGVSAIQGIMYFLLGQQTIQLESFASWYLFTHLVYLLGSIVFLKYFNFRKYHFAFAATALAALAGFMQFVIVYSAFWGIRMLMPFYMVATTLLIGSGILIGLSLIFSEARRRYWLRLLGFFQLTVSIMMAVGVIWYSVSTSGDKALMIEEFHKWLAIFICIGPLLMMMNLLREQGELKPGDPEATSSRSLESTMIAIRFIATIAAVFFALKLTSQTASKISWERQMKSKEKEWEKVWGAETFAWRAGDTLKYQLIKPLDFDSTKKYPMVVCLPYGGGIEGSPPAQFLLTQSNRTKYPAFLFVPFCPNGSGWGGIPNYPTMDTLVFASIEALEKKYDAIDAHRIYVTGVSRGGYGSWHFISLRPDMFAAAMPVCGGGDPDRASNMVNVAVWAFHGEDDINVPVSGSRDMIAAIKRSGGNPKYTEFEGEGHNIWHFVTQTPGVMDWMFEQKRSD